MDFFERFWGWLVRKPDAEAPLGEVILDDYHMAAQLALWAIREVTREKEVWWAYGEDELGPHLEYKLPRYLTDEELAKVEDWVNDRVLTRNWLPPQGPVSLRRYFRPMAGLGLVKIVKDVAINMDTRRMYLVCGRDALTYARTLESDFRKSAEVLKLDVRTGKALGPVKLVETLTKRVDESKRMHAELRDLSEDPKERSFMARALANEFAEPDLKLNQFVDLWHIDANIHRLQPLHEWLGFTWEEYSHWVEHPLDRPTSRARYRESRIVALLEKLKVKFPWGAELTCTAVPESDTGIYVPVLSVGMPTHATTIPLTRESAIQLKNWLVSYLAETENP